MPTAQIWARGMGNEGEEEEEEQEQG